MMLGVSPEGRAVRTATEGGWWWMWGGCPGAPDAPWEARKMGLVGSFYVGYRNVVGRIEGRLDAQQARTDAILN